MGGADANNFATDNSNAPEELPTEVPASNEVPVDDPVLGSSRGPPDVGDQIVNNRPSNRASDPVVQNNSVVGTDETNNTEPFPSDDASEPNVPNNSVVGTDEINNAELYYLGWKDHGVKNRKDFNSKNVRYKSVANWLKAKEICCMLLNPDDFDNFEAAGDPEFGAFIIEEADLVHELKGASKVSSNGNLVEVGSYKIRIEAFNNNHESYLTAHVDGSGSTRHFIQKREYVPPGLSGCMDISLKLGDELEGLQKRLDKFVQDTKK